MQAKDQPHYPLLYSLGGSRYCDLLLAAPERAAWQIVMRTAAVSERSAAALSPGQHLSKVSTSVSMFGPSAGGSADTPELLDLCRAVAQRAAQTLKWVTEGNLGLLTIALDHLTLGRAALYEAILKESEIRHPILEVGRALDGLRSASAQEFIVRGLLTRAWFRTLTATTNRPESAQEDLDEAWEIAERGPMRLFMADIHLYRARLFGGRKDEGGGKYPWNKNPDGSERGPKDDLAAARKLIVQCGYWRRKEELEDAEEAAKNW